MSKTKLSDDDLFFKLFEQIPEGRTQTDIQETVLCGALIRMKTANLCLAASSFKQQRWAFVRAARKLYPKVVSVLESSKFDLNSESYRSFTQTTTRQGFIQRHRLLRALMQLSDDCVGLSAHNHSYLFLREQRWRIEAVLNLRDSDYFLKKHAIVVRIVQGLKSLLNCLKRILEKGLAHLLWMIFFGAKPSTIKNHLFVHAFQKTHRHAYCCRRLLKPMPRSIQDAAFLATKSLKQDLKTMFYPRSLTSIDLGI